MNEEEWNWKPVNYVFHIQNPEDFYNQMRQFADRYNDEDEVEDLSTAKEMLQAIGIKIE